MDIRKVQALRGPNIWANFPVLEAWVDLGPYADKASDELPGFNDRLMTWLPTMIEHRCSVGTRGGFFERLRRGTYLAHILEHVTLELQTLAGSEVGFGRARGTSKDGLYRVAIEYEEEDLARACLDTAHSLCLAAVHDRPVDVHAAVQQLRDVRERVRLQPGMAAIVEAARQRGVPVRRLERGLVQLGYGARLRRLLDGHTDRTSALAAYVAEDQELTYRLLRSVGVLVPDGRVVQDAEDAWDAVEECGLPVIVRPQDRIHDAMRQKPLTTREEVVKAVAAVAERSSSVMVETFIPGRLHRLLLIDGNVAAVLREEVDPGLNGYCGHPESVRTNGAVMPAPPKARWMDVTDRIHSDIAMQAAEAARVIGLNVAELDVIAIDIHRPLADQRGAVIAVRARPELQPYLCPAQGQPRPIGQALVEHLFPGGADGRIPIVAVTGVNGKTTTTRLIAHILSQAGYPVGMTCTDGIFIGSRRIDDGDCSGPKSAHMVLQNPRVEAAVFETARGGILREGLGFDLCDIAVVTNIGDGDHLGLNEINTPEDLARVKATIVEVVRPTGAAVLNARDPLVANMKERSRGAVVFFALDPNESVLASNRKTGGAAAFVRNGAMVLAEGESETILMPLADAPLTGGGKISFQVENALAAAAAGWKLGLPMDTIRAGLRTFGSAMDQSPGRFNVLEIRDATVIVDYGHNKSALVALLETLAQFPHQRRLAVYSTAGDRRDSDLIEQGELLGNAFDHVFLYEDHYRRGRAPGEIIALFRQGLSRGSRVSQVSAVEGAIKAMETALAALRPRDLLLLQADEIDETVMFMRRYLADGYPSREIPINGVLQASRQCSVAADGPLANPVGTRVGQNTVEGVE